MKRIVLSLLSIFMALALAHTANAEGGICDGCDAAGKARERSVVGKGRPDPSAVCFYVAMSDRSDSVAVTITYGARGPGKPITFPRGAAQAMSGERDAPMICIPAAQLRGATQVVAIPGSKDGCGILRESHIAILLKRRDIPKDDPVCLLKEGQCRALFAKAS